MYRSGNAPVLVENRSLSLLMDNQPMRVSVIMPVYNAEKYLAQAIDSALVQEEVMEVILIEDNSPDGALKICADYAARNERVKLLRHPNGENRGAGASRNLGIRHVKGDFIAFLDADDQFVPDRFKTAKAIFAAHPEAHGVYGQIGTIYYDQQFKEFHIKRVKSEITGLRQYVAPGELLKALLRGIYGHISVDSLVVKRDILTERFLFDETLLQAQDTDFMYRLAGTYKLYSSKEPEVVALRGVHGGNRVFNLHEAAVYRQRVLKKCINNNFYDCNDREVAIAVIKRYLEKTVINRIPFLPVKLKRKMAFFMYTLAHPGIALNLMRLTPGT